MSWTPGSRYARLQLEAPYDGVPPHLAGPLWVWCERFLQMGNGSVLLHFGVEMRMALPDVTGGTTQLRRGVEEVRRRCDQHEFHLDLIEYLLKNECAASDYGANDWQAADALEALLSSGNSAYRVRSDHFGLEMRTVPEVRESVEGVVGGAEGSPGEHLATAWNEAFSRIPDATKSYSESVKAVEAALARHVSPQNSKQTLGTMVADICNKPEKWQFELHDRAGQSVETVLHMMRTLWDGQTSRHGGPEPTRAETVEEAQAALMLAASLVQFGVSGAFRRVEQ